MEYILKNNIKLIYKKTMSNLTSISISVDAGACKEKDLLGLAHATEHMVYKGTKNRNEAQINKELSNIFAFQNAMTNFPYVIYYGSLLSEDFEKGLELFSDIILNPSFSEDGFKEEMNVIKEELNEWDEEVDQFCEDRLFLNSFKDRRIKYPIIGKMDSLNKINLADIKRFYKENYISNNISIAIVSNLDFEEVKSIVKKYFNSIDKRELALDSYIDYDVESFNKFKDIKAGLNTCKVELIFPIHNLSYDQIKALRIFNEYFGEGVNSLLFDTLRTKNGLVYDVLTKIAYEKYIKLYKIVFSTSKENLDTSLNLIEECINQASDLKNNLDKNNLLQFIKSMKLKRWFREEQGVVLAKELSTYSTMFGSYKVYDDEFNSLDKISLEFIEETVKKVLKIKSVQIISS